MHITDEYIRQFVPKPMYSNWFTGRMIDDTINGFRLEHDYTDRGAKLIILHHVILQCDTVIAPPPKPVLNQFNQIVFGFAENTSMNGIYSLGFIINAPKIFLQIPASVGDKYELLWYWQYIYNSEEK